MLDQETRFVDMTREQFQEHLDERSVNTRDGAAVARWFAEDAVQRHVATGEEARGRDAIRAAMDEVYHAFPDFRLEVRDLFASADRMCVECTMTGTHQGDLGGIPPTGRRIEVQACLLFRFDAAGRGVEETIYSDSNTMLRQLGLVPE